MPFGCPSCSAGSMHEIQDDGGRRPEGRGMLMNDITALIPSEMASGERPMAPPDRVRVEGRRSIPQVVIVDPDFARHDGLVRAAEAGRIRLQVCLDGRAAVRLARRHEADAWFVASDLADIAGIDLVGILIARRGGDGRRRHGVYLVARRYRMEDEQDALAAGVTGYLVQPDGAGLALESQWSRPPSPPGTPHAPEAAGVMNHRFC